MSGIIAFRKDSREVIQIQDSSLLLAVVERFRMLDLSRLAVDAVAVLVLTPIV